MIIKYGEGVINEVNDLQVCDLTIDYLPGCLRISLNDADHTTLEFYCDNLKNISMIKDCPIGKTTVMALGFMAEQEGE